MRDATTYEEFNFLHRAINISNHSAPGFAELVLEFHFPTGIQERLTVFVTHCLYFGLWAPLSPPTLVLALKFELNKGNMQFIC